ncbi:Glycoside hydrolase, superfamily [Metarhizium album ARSEF 1941]|uniref:Glycoside hydrolase, superfamily n=1 Tax=Metarhizium album (strain ARSEF 1941) TaxID=1081103 RepID=A0A0B2WY47_METAS|nr:Glycoside hydrolase, superfamily [Metarhizium album ARSEF 1941]KHO01202.1 Glycoside hydrolase, superfamily [Metarhizium album ARSEF 1941]
MLPNYMLKSLAAAAALLGASRATSCDKLDELDELPELRELCKTPGLYELHILAGQRVVYSYSSTEPPEHLLRLTEAGLVGGIILFSENIGPNTKQTVDAFKEAYRKSPAPRVLKSKTHLKGQARFMVMMDQEGGKVRRIKDQEPKRSAKEIGASSDPAAEGAKAGAGAAATLLTYGCNVNLAPVLDIYRQPGDFTDFYQRSFGNTSDQVARAAVPFIAAQQARGVAACAKHFPGLGAAPHDANTDARPVVLNQTLCDIRTVDEAPYKEAIRAGVALVMFSWAVYSAVDDKPAGLSKFWGDELRRKLRFEGVTVTDALEAGSLDAYGGFGERAVAATAAGVELIITSGRDPTQGEEARNGIVGAVQNGTLDRGAFDDSTKRIALMRSNIAR